MVHVARARRCEVVIFGKGQKLLTPVVLGGTGSILLNAAEGDETVQISRVESINGPAIPRPSKVVVPAWRWARSIREAAQLGRQLPGDPDDPPGRPSGRGTSPDP